jgi:hypothetical protein
MSTPEQKSRIPRHPAHVYHTTLVAIGALLLLLGGYALLQVLSSAYLASNLIHYLPPMTGAGVGVLFVALGVYGRDVGAGVQLVNTSFDLIGRGRLAEAERLLDEAERAHPRSLVLRVAAVQRGLIAMRRGDIEAALGHLDRAIDTPFGLLPRPQERVQALNARGIRAFLRATRGDREGARADIEAIRKSPDALPQGLGRAALAEAILIEKSGDRDALRAHLERERTLLLDATDRRERAIVRAFQRMLEAGASSVYRKQAKQADKDEAAEEPRLADWVGQVLPSAAPFVDTRSQREHTGAIEGPSASEAARRAVTEARKAGVKAAATPRKRGWKARVGLWFVWTLVFLGVWQFLSPDKPPAAAGRHAHRAPSDPTAFVGAMLVLFFLVFIIRFTWLLVRARKESRRLFAALSATARGAPEGPTELSSLVDSRLALVAGQALLTLARVAESKGDLEAALTHCDRGLARLAAYSARISASDMLLPDLVAERAFVLIALGRHDQDKAEAELADLPPAYPYRSRACFRVRLLALAKKGDIEAAAALAEQAGLDLPLSSRDELLADAVRAAATPELSGAVEIARIKREVRKGTEARRWMEIVAPAALAALEAVEEQPAPEDRDARAEDEALAIEEAARAEALATARASG